MVLALVTRFTEEGLVAEERQELLDPSDGKLLERAYALGHTLVETHGQGQGHVLVTFSSGHLPVLVTHATQGNWGNGPFMAGL